MKTELFFFMLKIWYSLILERFKSIIHPKMVEFEPMIFRSINIVFRKITTFEIIEGKI